MIDQPIPDVLVLGTGAAGLSAAVALSGAGAKVSLLERKPFVGGRAYSYPHPALNEVVDSQHVLLGCCTNLVDLCNLSGASQHIRWYDNITFLEPSTPSTPTRRSDIGSSGLPSPGHSALSFLRAPMLFFVRGLFRPAQLMYFLAMAIFALSRARLHLKTDDSWTKEKECM